MNIRSPLLIITASVLALSACGGGGGGSSAQPAITSGSGGSATTTTSSSTAANSTTTNSTTTTTNSSATTSQVFALLDPGESNNAMAQYAALASVDGLAYRTRWSTLEPGDGSYNWTALDAAFSAVAAQNKLLTVHVGVSGGAWPQWLQSAGAQTYTYSGPQGSVTDPVPWDSTFLARYGDFVSALANHIQSSGNMSRLRAISVGAPVSEMSLVGCQNNTMGSVTYNRSNYLQAWKTTIGNYASAFTSAPVFVSAPVNVICMPDNDGKNFYTELMNYSIALNAHTAVFAADLNALGSSRMNQVDTSISSQTAIDFQMIWSANPDPQNRMQGTLRDAVCKGLGYGTHYFEIYKTDLSSSDSAIQSAITTARSGQGCP